jgi:hypothetical protein
MSASLKHILLSFEEYERLKHIESEYHKLLHNKTQQNLEEDKSEEVQKEKNRIEINQSGSGQLENRDNYQSGSGLSKSGFSNDEEFINKIAMLVTKKIHPRLPQTIWNNFSLTSPSTSTTASENTSPPLHYDNVINKNDENDIYGKQKHLNKPLDFWTVLSSPVNYVYSHLTIYSPTNSSTIHPSQK